MTAHSRKWIQYPSGWESRNRRPTKPYPSLLLSFHHFSAPSTRTMTRICNLWDPWLGPTIHIAVDQRICIEHIPVYMRQILSLFLLKVRDHVDLCGDGTSTCPAKLYPPPFRCDSIKDTFCQHIYLCYITYNIYKYVNPHPTRRSFHRIPRSMHLIWCFDDGGWLVAGGRTLPKGQAKCMYI